MFRACFFLRYVGPALDESMPSWMAEEDAKMADASAVPIRRSSFQLEELARWRCLMYSHANKTKPRGQRASS